MKKLLLISLILISISCSKDEEPKETYHAIFLRGTCYSEANSKEFGPYCVSKEVLDRAWKDHKGKSGPCPEITFYTLDGKKVTGILDSSRSTDINPCG